MFANMSQEARKDLLIIAIATVIVFVLELITHVFEDIIRYFEELEASGFPFDFGELVAMPLVLALGFFYFSYRRYQELQGVLAARERAQRAAQAAQRQAEQARQEAEELQSLNQTLINAGSNAVIRVDPEGKITNANEDMEVATGLPGNRLVGSDVFSHFHDPVKARELFDQSLAGNPSQNGGVEIVHQDGGVTPVSYNALARRDAQGEVIGGTLILQPRD